VEAACKLSRRRFIQVAMAAAAAGSGAACTATRSPWRFLTVDEARTLAAICDQIIPPDQDPGAAWAGVVNYIDRQLCGPFKDWREVYRHGLAAVNQASRTVYGATFPDLPVQKQVEFLTLMEQDRVPGETWTEVSSTKLFGLAVDHTWEQTSFTRFFGLLVDHTMQGFYGDPRHGGNRDAASWKMLGVPYPPIRGRLKYDLTAKQ